MDKEQQAMDKKSKERTKNPKPKSKTLNILETEPDILRKLKKAEKEIAAGHYKIWQKKKK